MSSNQLLAQFHHVLSTNDYKKQFEYRIERYESKLSNEFNTSKCKQETNYETNKGYNHQIIQTILCLKINASSALHYQFKRAD